MSNVEAETINPKMIATWRGVSLMDMSKEDLIEAMHELAAMEKKERERANKLELENTDTFFKLARR